MENSKNISALNKLIEINNDRIEGYGTASKEASDTDLKSLFGELAATSQKNVSELHSEVKRLGRLPTFRSSAASMVEISPMPSPAKVPRRIVAAS